MKKYIKLISVLLLTAALSACGGNAENVPETELEDTEAFTETERTDSIYIDDGADSETLSNGEYEYIPYPDHIKLVKYFGNEEEVTVPSEIEGVKVTVIGEQTFARRENIKKITVPDSVTQIEANAFSGCTNLSEVYLPETIDRIETLTFDSCESLTEITIPDGVTVIEMWAFLYCENLKKVTIPDSVTVIEDFAFQSCNSLEDVTLPSSADIEQLDLVFDDESPWYKKNYGE